jgi:urea transport system substrate-binding protein
MDQKIAQFVEFEQAVRRDQRLFGSDTLDEVTSGPPTLDVALVVPVTGSAGIFGPSCELCAQLAAEELNQGGGVLGRQVRLVHVDAGQAPAQVAEEVIQLVRSQQVEAVVGWHISAVRQILAPRIAEQVPYVYTALYEGGERTPGVFMAGETPHDQLLPAMRLLRRERGVRRWCIVGNDYVWPRVTAAAAADYAGLCDGSICEQMFVPLGTKDFSPVIQRLRAARPDGVVMLLVGEDAVHFNRAFAEAGCDDRCLRLSTLIDENVLLGSGVGATHGVTAAAAYFETLVTPESLDFGARYTRRFGAEAPTLNSVGESCYEGVRLLSELAVGAAGLNVGAMSRIADRVVHTGPRGELKLRSRHLEQPVYLAEAHGLELDVIAQL